MKSVPLDRLQAEFGRMLLDTQTPVSLASALGARMPTWAALYRANVHANWEKTLAGVFPVVRMLVGAEFFSALALAYGRACRSADGDLNWFGAQFANFIRVFEHAQALPYLSDVAALEWLAFRAGYAGDMASLSRECAAAMSPQELLAARFVLHPACTWFHSEFPVATIWRAHQPGSPVAMPPTLHQREWALVARPLWQVEVVESSAAELAALATLREGGAMDDAIGAALVQNASFDFARAFVHWLDLGLLVGKRCKEKPRHRVQRST